MQGEKVMRDEGKAEVLLMPSLTQTSLVRLIVPRVLNPLSWEAEAGSRMKLLLFQGEWLATYYAT